MLTKQEANESRRKKQEWIVRMQCVVNKEIITSACTEQEATNDPWEHAEDEREIDQVAWEVLSVRPNN